MIKINKSYFKKIAPLIAYYSSTYNETTSFVGPRRILLTFLVNCEGMS